MADLPANVAEHLMKEGSESHQALLNDIRQNGAHVHNLARLVAVRKHDELDSIESRAHSGVMATPIASPAVQTGKPQ